MICTTQGSAPFSPADTAGSYLLTNQNLRFTNINWTFFIAAGALTVVCLIVYIAVKKRYWFW